MVFLGLVSQDLSSSFLQPSDGTIHRRFQDWQADPGHKLASIETIILARLTVSAPPGSWSQIWSRIIHRTMKSVLPSAGSTCRQYGLRTNLIPLMGYYTGLTELHANAHPYSSPRSSFSVSTFCLKRLTVRFLEAAYELVTQSRTRKLLPSTCPIRVGLSSTSFSWGKFALPPSAQKE
jgi:hypothetical protein